MSKISDNCSLMLLLIKLILVVVGVILLLINLLSVWIMAQVLVL